MKLTTNQIIACNIIDELIRARTQSKDDIILQLKASEEFNNYCKSNDRNDLTIMKDWTKQLCDIFNKAQEDWNEQYHPCGDCAYYGDCTTNPKECIYSFIKEDD